MPTIEITERQALLLRNLAIQTAAKKRAAAKRTDDPTMQKIYIKVAGDFDDIVQLLVDGRIE